MSSATSSVSCAPPTVHKLPPPSSAETSHTKHTEKNGMHYNNITIHIYILIFYIHICGNCSKTMQIIPVILVVTESTGWGYLGSHYGSSAMNEPVAELFTYEGPAGDGH